MGGPYPRTRSRGSLGTVQYGTNQTWSYNSSLACTVAGNVVNTGIGDMASNGSSDYTEDVVTPAFREKSRNGAIFNSRFYRLRKVASFSGGSNVTGTYIGASKAPGNSCKYVKVNPIASYANLASFPSLPAVDLEVAKTLAGTMAQGNVQSADALLLVDVAEYRKTLQMLRSPFEAARKAAWRMRHDYYRGRRLKKIPRGVSFADFCSSAWLEARYGWLPTLYSLRGALEALSKERKSQRHTARGSSHVPLQSSTTIRDGLAYAPREVYRATFVRTRSFSVRAGILYEAHISLENDLGLTLDQLPQTGLELIPFSFVAGWFVNVSEWLSAVTPKVGARVLSSWTTVRIQDTWDYTSTVTVQSDSSWSMAGGGSIRAIRTEDSLTREPGVSIGLVSKVGEIDFSRAKDFKHLADAAALIWQVLLGKRVHKQLMKG